MFTGRLGRWGTDTIHSPRDRLSGRARPQCWDHSNRVNPYCYENCFLAIQTLIDESFLNIKSPNSSLPRIWLQVCNEAWYISKSILIFVWNFQRYPDKPYSIDTFYGSILTLMPLGIVCSFIFAIYNMIMVRYWFLFNRSKFFFYKRISCRKLAKKEKIRWIHFWHCMEYPNLCCGLHGFPRLLL